MELRLRRYEVTERYTLGRLTIDGYDAEFPTIEDTIRTDKKVWGETAIPSGRYEITLKVRSPKFSQYAFYMDACDGFLPRLKNVPNYEGILIHCGRNENQSSGCILLNRYDAPLNESKQYFKHLYDILKEGENEGIYITII